MSTKYSTKTVWNYESYAAIPFDGRRHEILNGEHLVNPAPNLYHQQISRRLQYQLYSSLELSGLGVVINAPVDVQLSDHDIVQPDLVIVTKSRFQIMTPTKVKGIPDLLVEILSPSNPGQDLQLKRSTYQRCGVAEYWIVMPDEHQVLQLVLEHGEYREQTCDNEITMLVPPHHKVDLTKVW